MFRAVGVRGPFLIASLIILTLTQPLSPLAAGEPASPIVLPLPYRTSAAQVGFDLEIVVLNLVNKERVAAGLTPVMPHATMRAVARTHGAELFAAGILSHRSLDGRTPQQRVHDQQLRVRIVGENLAYAPDVRTAHDALMASTPHRHNILSTAYALVGIGVLDAGPYGMIVVQNFSDAPFAASSRSAQPSRSTPGGLRVKKPRSQRRRLTANSRGTKNSPLSHRA